MPDPRLPQFNRYISRPAETLVLEGYRRWTQSVIAASPAPMDNARALYSELLGVAVSRPVFTAMADFVHTLGVCAKCPLHTFSANAKDVCLDELLVLGMISGIQNGDDEAAELALTHLSCPNRCDQVALAAGSFALILKGASKTLLPIPAPALASVIKSQSKMTANNCNNQFSHTIH